jgi:hypothetical protein
VHLGDLTPAQRHLVITLVEVAAAQNRENVKAAPVSGQSGTATATVEQSCARAAA